MIPISKLPVSNAFVREKDYLIGEVNKITSLIPGALFINNERLTVNPQIGLTYTPLAVDVDGQTIITMSNPLPNTVVVPPDSTLTAATNIAILVAQLGVGATSIVAGPGVSIVSNTTQQCRTQNSTVALIKLAANSWILVGDLAPVGTVVKYGPAQFFSVAPAGANLVLSGGNLIGSCTLGGWKVARISDAYNNQTYNITDKRYFEVTMSGPNFGMGIGFITNGGSNLGTSNPFNTGVYCALGGNSQYGTGVIINGSLTGNAAFAQPTTSCVLGVALNGANGKTFFSTNGVWVNSANPSSDTGPAFTLPGQNFTAFITAGDTLSNYSASWTLTANNGIQYALPTGYKTWAQQ